MMHNIHIGELYEACVGTMEETITVIYESYIGLI